MRTDRGGCSDEHGETPASEGRGGERATPWTEEPREAEEVGAAMATTADRIPFAEAIAERSLLRTRFDQLSLPQQVALKLIYGVPLSPYVIDPKTGFSELDYWSIFHGAVELDELGFPKRILPGAPTYAPTEYREAWLIFGRRTGKTDAIASTVVAYEAVLGGHERFLRPRQQGLCFQIAQDLRMARNSLHFVRAVLETSPLMEKEITQITADRIDLRNRFTIACVPATLKSVRGYASPMGVMDEVGVWYQEASSANPDYEIYSALSPGQMQFPDRRIIGISSPWNKAGLLYQYYEAGTGGYKHSSKALAEQYKGALCVHGPTAVMNNPLVTREYLKKERERDPRAFEREVLAQFQDSISGFIPAGLVEMAKVAGVFERAPDPARFNYQAAIDPAFRRDAFALTIMHKEGSTIVQDVARRWIAPIGGALTPEVVLSEMIPILRRYGLRFVFSDQYHLESLGQLLRDRGQIEIVGVTFTSKSKAQMYGNLQQLFLQRRLLLLDDYETIRELKSLERTISPGGSVQIGAPVGLHDDMATVVCVAASQSMWDHEKQRGEEEAKSDSIHVRCQEQVRRNWVQSQETSAWD